MTTDCFCFASINSPKHNKRQIVTSQLVMLIIIKLKR